MKTTKLLLALLCLIACSASYCQNSGRFHHILSQETIDDWEYTLQQRVTTKDTSVVVRTVGGEQIKTVVVSDKTTTNPLNIKEPIKCIITVDKGFLAVDVWQITKNAADIDSNSVRRSIPLSNIILTDKRLRVGDPTRVIKVPFFAMTWAIGTTPLRYRLAQDSSTATVSSALGLSLSYGPTFGKTTFSSRNAIHLSFTPAAFIGFSTADIKKETVKTPKLWELNKTTSRTNMALSYGISFTFARNNLGAVLSFGFDSAIGPKRNDWSYNNKPWIGIGINTGLGIFK